MKELLSLISPNKKYILVTPLFNNKIILNELAKSSLIYNITFISIDKLIENITFSLSDIDKYKFIKKHNIRIDDIDNIIKKYRYQYLLNMASTDDIIFSDLLCFVSDLNKMYINYYQNIEIIFFGYHNLLLVDLVVSFLNIANCLTLDYDVEKSPDLRYYSYKTYLEEAESIAYKIVNDLDSNISVDDIKILSQNELLLDCLELILDNYGIFLKRKKRYLLSNVAGLADHLSTILNYKDLSDIENYVHDIINDNVRKNLENIIKAYLFIFKESDIEFRAELANYFLTASTSTTGIEVLTDTNILTYESGVIYIMGFSHSSLKIDKYLDKINKDSVINHIYHYENEIFSLEKLMHGKGRIIFSLANFYTEPSDVPSLLKSDLEKRIYQSEARKFTYGEYDLLLNLAESNLSKLYKIPDKKVFSYHFTDSRLLSGKINLSYSFINNYISCSYRFLLDRVLKLNEREDSSYQLQLGNLLHYVLSTFLKFVDINPNTLITDVFEISEIKEQMLSTFNNMHFMQIEFFKVQITKLADYLLSLIKKYDFKVKTIEKKYVKEIDNRHNLEGKIDAILGNDKCGLIIDFKSSEKKISKQYLNIEDEALQLLIYLYLFDSLDTSAVYLPVFDKIKSKSDKTESIYKIVGLLSENFKIDEIKPPIILESNYQEELLSLLKKFILRLHLNTFKYPNIPTKKNCKFCLNFDICLNANELSIEEGDDEQI